MRPHTSLSVVMLAALLAACGDAAPTSPAGARPVPVAVTASLTAAQQQFIAGMSVEVTGPGIPVPIIAVLDVAGSSVNGTVTVPAGADRQFTVRAYDVGGRETYAGSTIAAVSAGTNSPVTVTLRPRDGGVPVIVTVGGASLALDVSAVTLAVGGSATVTATVTEDGTPVTSDVVQWGALNPTLLGIAPSADGRTVQLTGRGEGSTVLVAHFGALVAAVMVTIEPGNPPPVSLLARLVAVSPTVSCAVAATSDVPGATGEVFCWGDNSFGQVGVAGESLILTPRHVTTLGQVGQIQLGAGFIHVCARPWPGSDTDPGSAVCWGDPTAFGGTGSAPQRLELPGGLQTVHLAVGPQHTCLTGNDGRVHCAGDPGSDRLGGVPTEDGPFVTVTSPTLPFKSAAAGFHHTCALTITGAAYCWGDNSRGQLGDGGTTSSRFPVRAAAGLELEWLWAGENVTCGLTTGRELWCWGDNLRGQLARDPFDTRDGGPLHYSSTAIRVRPAAELGGALVEARVPQWLDAGTQAVTWWGTQAGTFFETPRFSGSFRQASGFDGRFCGVEFLSLRCTGAHPGNGETDAAGFVSVDLSAALTGGGSMP